MLADVEGVAAGHRSRRPFTSAAQIMLTAGLDIRVPTEDGELLRHPKLDPTRDISHWAPSRVHDVLIHPSTTSTTCRV
jgi:hypothetical protein